ncbi:hypothetical protein CEXT_342001 [Caerostris extrusa]|uniref:Uncharacterized protein n=1 Tax=Caerostris extrusa TaxID=172846 RepID=A0AAV4P9Z5_CAEEX|nr:hypothetical protein CEXT_342001 [Caerostris extrusa]
MIEAEKQKNEAPRDGRASLERERERGALNFKHYITSSPLLNHPSTFVLLASTIGDSAPGIEKEEYEKKQAKKSIAASNLGRGFLHICPPLETNGVSRCLYAASGVRGGCRNEGPFRLQMTDGLYYSRTFWRYWLFE